MSSLGIVIPVYNQLSYTKKVLTNLQDSCKSDNFDILVIDNSPIDETEAYLKESNITYLRNKENPGVSVAWNQGLDYFKNKDYVAILNNDILLSDYWDVEMMTALKIVPLATMAIPGLQTHHHPPQNLNARLKTSYRNDRQISRFTHPIGGFCFMLKRMGNQFASGKFRDDLKIWYGDTEFFCRIRDEGFLTVSVTTVYCHHYESRTIYTIENIDDQIEADRLTYEQILKDRETV